jgi:hypothetical protein
MIRWRRSREKGELVLAQHRPQSPAQSSAKLSVCTFAAFADLARCRNWTVDELAGRFAGRLDRPADFFARVLSDKFKDNIVPFRTVIEFYQSAIAGPTSTARPTCACGCGRVVFDRKKWAQPGCRTRFGRDRQIGEQQPLDFVDARLRQNRRVGTLLSTGARSGENGL